MDRINDFKLIIPPKTIITILVTIFLVGILYQIRDILILFLIVVALVVTFSPIIRSWEKYIPRPLAIFLLYLLLALSVTLVGVLVLPVFFTQLRDFLFHLYETANYYGINSGDIYNQLRNLQGTQNFGQLLGQFRGSLGTLYSTTMGFVGGLIALFTVLVTTFYLLLEEKNLQQSITSLIPVNQHKRASNIFDKISDKMGRYLRGQVLLMLIVGVVIGVAMKILGVPYAMLLGIWAGSMELLPYVGPIVGALPGVLLAFTLGPTYGIIALIIYFLVQQLENQFLVPKIMGHALGLSPVVIIFSLLIGGKLLGFVGLLIAVPITAALGVLYEEWRSSHLNEA